MTLPAIFFHPDGYTTSDTRVMGRRVAGRDFLRAHFEAAAARGVERLTCHGPNRDLAVMFARLGRENGYAGKVRWADLEGLAPLAEDGTLYLPDPSLAPHAAFREKVGRHRYSLCGVIHTLVSSDTLGLIAELAVAPIAPWDALICSSRAGRAVVEEVLSRREAWLAQHLGATRFVRPELPVIPLGVHVEDYAGLSHDRDEARAALGLPPDAKVVVFVGRLSLHAKAHPLPMYLALAKASEELGPIVLLEVGSFGDPSTGEAFRELRAAFPGLLGGVVGGERPASEDEKHACLAAADVFVSLADNAQETFGLSVIEAMAAGLPVVVSDWDGYKDTVVDGVTGVRVPTGLPCVGAADALVEAYQRTLIDYDRYVGYLSQHCVVDIDATAAALVALLAHPERARAMGGAAAAHARQFSWRVVYERYEALWAELAARRAGAGEATRGPARVWEHAEDLYASFPTWRSSPNEGWRLRQGGQLELLGLAGVRAAMEGVLPPERALELIQRFGADDTVRVTASGLARDPNDPHEVAMRLGELHALAKYGLVERVDDA